MPNIISPSALINPEAPPIQGMIDAIENKCADYIMTYGKLPKYLYLNNVLWNDVAIGLLGTVELYGLEVVTHEDMPYEQADLSAEYKEPKMVARRHRDMAADLDYALARGLITVD